MRNNKLSQDDLVFSFCTELVSIGHSTCKTIGLYVQWLRFPTSWLTDRHAGVVKTISSEAAASYAETTNMNVSKLVHRRQAETTDSQE